MKLLTISVILPTYNEEKLIDKCLKSIREQKYPQEKIEIIIVDDFSTDKTLEIAKKFAVKVINNGSHDTQVGRSIGLRKSRGELVLLIDADNVLVSRSWLRQSVQPFLENPDLVAAQPAWWQYQRNDFIINRYAALFGINLPLAFFLKKRAFLMATEKKWMYPKTLVKKTGHYFLIRFTHQELPTMGCQGFLVKRKLLLKTNFEPRFFHMDVVLELVEKGHNLLAITPLTITHQFVDSFTEYHRKIFKFTTNFLRFRQKRKYTYQTSFFRRLWALFLMMTIVVPLWQSIKGFTKIKDPAWFLHPVLCLTTPLVSGLAVLKWKIRSLR